MKIGIIKGGANITFSRNNTSAASADILYALRVLNPYINDITIITHYTRNSYIPEPLHFKEILDNDLNLDEFDIILLFNFSINFFGGVENPSLIQLYRKLHNSSVLILYCQTDGQLSFKKLWPMIEGRDWALNYTEKEFEIDENRIIILTQGRDLIKCTRQYNKFDDTLGNVFIHYPWETCILAKWKEFFGEPDFDYSKREYDLMYGGATRNSFRKNRIEYYYSGLENVKVNLFGNLRLDSKQNVEMSSKVSFQDFIYKMKQSKTTIIIGDEFYENNFFTLRMYESLLAGCLTFIDSRLDTNCIFYKNSNRMYVNHYETVPGILNNNSIIHLQEVAKQNFIEKITIYDLNKESEKFNELIRDIK